MRVSYYPIVKFSGLAGLISVLAVTAGCGGGGGGSNPSNSGFAIPSDLTKLAPGVVSPLSNTLLGWTPGDEWYYAINGQFRDPANNILQVQGGYLGLTVGVPTSTGEAGTLALTDQRYINFSNNTVVISDLNTYLNSTAAGLVEVADTADTSGNIEYSGNSLCAQSNGFEIVPATFTASTGITGDSAFYVPTGQPDTTTAACALGGSNISNQEHTSFTVLDQETVTVPAGTFQTWKVRSTRDDISTGTNAVDVEWWAPQIGGFVKRVSERDTAKPLGHESYTFQLIGFKAQPVPIVNPLNRK